MDKLKNLFIKYPLSWLFAVLSLVSLDFIYKLVLALQDGVIDPQEYAILTTGASGVEMIILGIIMSVLKKKL